MVKIKNIYAKRIILLTLTLISILILSEVLLRLTYPLYADYNSEMWRYAKELKQLSIYPGLGHEHIPNTSAFLYGVNISINSMGIRSDKEYIIPKSSNVKRILVLGDSVTFGWGVKYNETYPYLLEKMLNANLSASIKYEVVNTGVGNYGTANELAALKKFTYLNPDIIIIGFFFNDLEAVEYPSRIKYFFGKHFYLYSFISDKLLNLRNGKLSNYNIHYTIYNDTLLKNSFKNNMYEIEEITNNNLLPLIVVNIPEHYQFKDYPFLEENHFIESLVNVNNHSFYLNLLPVYQNLSITSTELWVSKEDPHPNAKSQKIIADNIYSYLLKEGLVK